MSDNIPLEIQVEIIKRLPVKSLIQFRSVSKAWQFLIDSSDFIAGYSRQLTQLQHILVSYEDPGCSERKYVSIADDSTFPQKKVSLTVPILLRNVVLVSSSYGLLCLFGDYEEDLDGAISAREMVVIWNLSIRKAVTVVMPLYPYGTILGFGVCRETTDPKIVRITRPNTWQVEVFTLTTGAWRSLNNLPSESILFSASQDFVDGFHYWLATADGTDARFRNCNLIISFDITNEEFKEIDLPNSLACVPHYNLCISKIRESLVVLELDIEAHNPECCVWMMGNGDPKAFTKLFNVSFNTPHESIVVTRGFRKTGEAIIEITEDDRGQLFAYEPYSKHINNLGVEGVKYSFDVYSYMETLLLLDQPNLKVYKKNIKPQFQDDLDCTMFQELLI